MGTRRTRLVALVLAALPALHARAHFGPAEPPDFGTPQCIVVVDRRTTSRVDVTYELGFDDTEPELGHIWLADSKTHQFFAFRGAVVPALPRYEFWPFAGTDSALLPLWIDRDDLQRADAANDPSIAPDFSAAMIGDDLLAARADVANQWLAISEAPRRVPITLEQAAKGVTWDVSEVPTGVYQLVSYTFSPPFNAWEPRPGVIKVIDGRADPPAVTIDSVDSVLYAGQGRRVTGCVDAPAGSKLSVWYSAEVEAPHVWQPWLSGVPLTAATIDLCFGSRDPNLSGMLRLRIGVKSPAGLETFAYSRDAVVLVATPASCTPSETQCCEPTPQPAPAPAAATTPAMPAPPMQPATTNAEHGCTALRGSPRSHAWLRAVLAALALGVARRARRPERRLAT